MARFGAENEAISKARFGLTQFLLPSNRDQEDRGAKPSGGGGKVAMRKQALFISDRDAAVARAPTKFKVANGKFYAIGWKA